MSLAAAHRLRSVVLDEASLPHAGKAVDDERQQAITDLLEANEFRPEGGEGGPYDLSLALIEQRLAFDITGPNYARRHLLSLTPFKGIIRDYFLVCESYNQAIRTSSPGQIEAIDMGRRGLHNEGSELLRERTLFILQAKRMARTGGIAISSAGAGRRSG